MIKNTRKLVALLLVFLMVLGNVSFANPYVDYMKSLDGTSTKLANFANFDFDNEKEARIIVEFYEETVIEKATNMGMKVEAFGQSKIDALVNGIKAAQAPRLDEVKQAFATAAFEPKVEKQFATVFNGASLVVPADRDLLEKIEGFEFVKAVYLANEYERPTPEMVESHNLTQSKYVNEQLGLKGEGMVVAVIDTGVDPSHQDFVIDADAQALAPLTQSLVNQLISENSLKGTFRTLKVPYGYNYMDNNLEILDLGPEASMHGMHVSGTVAANGKVQGVAPNAQVLALKVFGNDPDYPSTYSDIIIAAIEDAIILGADVMNLSLGSTSAYVDADDPEQQAVTRAVENGIVMSISAGNSAYMGYGKSLPFATNPDVGVVGAPGLTPESIQVASVDNTKYLYKTTVTVPGTDISVEGYGGDDWGQGPLELVAIGGDKLGVADDNYEGIDVTGKIALVSRGGYSFYDKHNKALENGAIGIIVYNNDPKRSIYYNQGGWGIDFMLTNVDGQVLETLFENPGDTATIQVDTFLKYMDPNSGAVSDFSSWGTTPELNFKPDIAAPGGGIYSTFQDNTYGFMSGTSMAAPHVAGGSALMLQRLNTTDDFKNLYSTEEEKARLAKAILMNTARPISDWEYWFDPGEEAETDELITYTSPRSQGAGSMDLRSAIETDVVVLVKGTLDASFNAGEVTDGFSFTLTAYNQGETDAEFGVNAVIQSNQERGGKNQLESMALWGAGVTVSVDGQPVQYVNVPAGGQLDLQVDVDVTNAFFPDSGKSFFEAYPNGNFVEGFVFLYTREEATFGPVAALRQAYDASVVALTEADALVKELTTKLEEATLALEEAQKAYDDALEQNTKFAEENGDFLARFETYETLTADLAAAQATFDALIEANGTLEDLTAKKDAAVTYLAVKAVYDATEAAFTPENDKLTTLKKAVNTAKEALTKADELVADLTAQLEEARNAEDPDQALIEELEGKLTEASEAVQLAEIALRTAETEKAAQEAIVTPLKQTFNAANKALKTEKANLEAAGLNPDTVVEDLAAINTAITALEAAQAEVDRLTEALDAEKANFTEEEFAQYAVLIVLEKGFADALTTADEKLQEAKDLVTDLTSQLEAAKLALEAAEAAYNEASAAYLAAIKAYRRALPLSVPFIGFKGNWEDAPAFDGLRGSANSLYNLTTLLYNNSDEDQGYFMGEVSAFSPANNDGYKDQIASVVSFLRNMKDVKFTIRNDKGQTIKTLAYGFDQRKDWYDAGSGPNYSYFPEHSWDGRVNMRMAKDGNYEYVISGTLADKATYKEIAFPVMLDNTAPEFESIQIVDGKVVVAFTDNLSGIRDYALFALYADKEPEVLEMNNQTGEFDVYAYLAVDDQIAALQFIAIDHAGNLGLAGEEDVVGVEFARPEVVLSTPAPYDLIMTNDVVFTGAVGDHSPFVFTIGNQVVVEGKTNGQVLEFEHTMTLADGKHEIPVKAVDAVGNITEFTRHFFVDATAPTLEVKVLVNGEEATVENGEVTVPEGTEFVEVSYMAADNFPDIKVTVNESVVKHISVDFQGTRVNLKPVEVSGVEKLYLNGETTMPIYVEAIDAAGHKATFGIEAKEQQPAPPPSSNTGGGQTGPRDGSTNTPVLPPLVPATGGGEIETILEPITPLGALGKVTTTKNYINGFEDKTFRPEDTLTRAQFAKMIAEIAGLEVVESDKSYSDLGSDWYTDYIKAVVSNDIMLGYDNGKFMPNQNITRAEIAQVLANLWTFNGLKVEAGPSGFADVVGHKNEEAINQVKAANVVNGYGDNTFKPDNKATRAEAVKMLNVFMSRPQVEKSDIQFTDIQGHWAEDFIKSASSLLK